MPVPAQNADDIYNSILAGTSQGLRDSLPVLVSAGVTKAADLLTDGKISSSIDNAANTAQIAVIVFGLVAVIWILKR